MIGAHTRILVLFLGALNHFFKKSNRSRIIDCQMQLPGVSFYILSIYRIRCLKLFLSREKSLCDMTSLARALAIKGKIPCNAASDQQRHILCEGPRSGLVDCDVQ